LSQALSAGCRVEPRLSPEPLAVDANAEQIEQIFLNLAANAMAAMAPGGGVLTVLLEAKGESAWARFRDTGPGIAKEVAPTLFQPFVTGRPNGTGLGLYSSRRIAREHGGDLLAEDAPGPGAKFALRLPLASASKESPE
jgi:signal transduction histidine kinase